MSGGLGQAAFLAQGGHYTRRVGLVLLQAVRPEVAGGAVATSVALDAVIAGQGIVTYPL